MAKLNECTLRWWDTDKTYTRRCEGVYLGVDLLGVCEVFCVLGMYVAFPRVEFAVINHTLHDWLKFVYCSIVEAYGKSWKYTDTRYARKYN